jgi:hypothetical protein
MPVAQCPLQQPVAAVLALVHALSAPAASAVWPPIAAAAAAQQYRVSEQRLVGCKASVSLGLQGYNVEQLHIEQDYMLVLSTAAAALATQ